MPDKETGGRKSIGEVSHLRARAAKLERISRDRAKGSQVDEELDRAWTEWETTFDTIQDSIMLLDGEFNIIQANAATSRLLGRPLDEIVGNKCCRLVHGTDAPPKGCPLSKSVSTKKRQKTELHIPEKDIWAVVSVDPILDEQGNMTGAVHTLRDITDRKKAEEALRESEEHFRNIFENAVLGLYRTTPDGRILMANPTLLRMLGYASFGQLARRDLENEGFEPAYPRSIFKERIEADGQITGLESAWTRRDGTTLFVRESAKAVRDAKGNTLYYEGTVENITERKKAEEAYKALVDHSLQGLVVLQDARFVFANEAMAGITGYSVEEILAMSPDQARALVHPDDQETVWSNHEKRMSGGKAPEQYTFRGVRKDGQVCWLEIHGSLIGYKGRPAIQAAFVDITERKKANETLRESERRYRLLFESMTSGVVVYAPVDDGADFVIKNFNRAGESIDHLDRKSIIGKRATEAFPGIKNFGLFTVLQRVYRTGKPEFFPEAFYEDKRTSGWRENRVYKLPTGEIVAIYNDITERKKAQKALRESEERYRGLFERAPFGIGMATPDGKILASNRIMELITGFSDEELKEINLADTYVNPNDRAKLLETLKTSGGVVDYSALLKRKDGTEYNASLTIGIVNIAGNNVLQTLVQDITEYKKAEEKIKLFSDAIASAFDCFMLTDTKGNITYANDSACKTFGYAHEEFLKLNTTRLDADPRVAKQIAQDVTTKGKWSGEVINLRKNGETFCSLLSAFTIRDEQGNPKGTMGILRDITERKKAEEALQAERQRLHDVLEAIPIMVCLLTPDYHVAFANHAFREKFGESHGRRCYEYCFGKKAPCDFCETYRVLETAKPHHWQVTTPDGASVIDAYDFPFSDVDGSPMILEMDIDITEQKHAEQALRDYQAELKSLASELSLTEERERRRIAAGIHDDIGQKLALAKMELQLLAGPPGKSRIPASLDSVCSKIDEAIKDAHSLTFELSNPALYDLSFEAAIDLWLLERIQKKHGIKCTVIAGEQTVVVDENSKVVLFRALRELAANVVKHAKATALTVAIEKLENAVQITCKDDGVGFTPPEDKALPRDVGGFGLFNIKERLEHLGGSMRLQSAPGRGTLITLSLPLERQNDADEGRQ